MSNNMMLGLNSPDTCLDLARAWPWRSQTPRPARLRPQTRFFTGSRTNAKCFNWAKIGEVFGYRLPGLRPRHVRNQVPERECDTSALGPEDGSIC